MQELGPQVEGQGKFKGAFLARRVDLAGGVAMILKPGQPPRFGFIGIDRLGVITAPAGVRDMIDAAAQRPAVPGIDQVERQRRLNRTPATASPERSVCVIGIRRPLQVTTWRPSTKPLALTCSRSTDEST